MKFIIGFIVGVVALCAAVYCYFAFGFAPVATASAPMPLEVKLAHMALEAKISRNAPAKTPFQATPADLENAAHQSRQHCAVCHGLPDGVESATQKGMFPKPPLLLHGKGVTDDPPGESYWKVKNGIRLTGMPAYGGALSERDLWSVSQLLAGADKLPPNVVAALNQPNP
jgi:mono/diheme cytochrome c family protein